MSSLLPTTFHPISRADVRLFEDAQERADAHDSGGSFSMCAIYRKGSWRYEGYNELKRPALLIHSSYPDICGVHAELDLYFRAKKAGCSSGGTVAIAGKKNRNGVQMPNTRPCAYCSLILRSLSWNFVVYLENGEIRKNRVDQLVRDLYSTHH